MKKITIALAFTVLTIFAIAQPPQAFKYQTVVRDGAGDIIQNQTVSLRMSIRWGSAYGPIAYRETHSTTTNEFGLVSVEIGNGTPDIGVFSNINWENSDYYLQTELDPAGGSSYISMGTSQLLSVPYALHAETSGDSYWEINGNDLYTSVSGNVSIGNLIPYKKLCVFEEFSSTNSVEDLMGIYRSTTGTPASGLGAGLTFSNEVSNGGYALSGRISSVLENASVPGSIAGMLFETRANGGLMTDALYLDPDGNIGIGTTNPLAKLDITGGIDLTGQIDHNFSGSVNATNASGNTPFAMYYIENNYEGDSWGLSAGMKNSNAGSSSYGIFGYNYGTGYGVYGKSYNSNGTAVFGKNDDSENYGYLGGASYGIYGYHNNGNFGYIGGPSYSVYGNLVVADPGNYAIYGYGTDASGEDGTGYDDSETLGGVKGYNYWGNPYTFGVAGYSYLDYNRSGGTFGAKASAGNVTWGCLAYKNSGGTLYGGYFTSYTSGTGKDSDVKTNNGIGAYGDLFGADIHGKVYGTYTEGGNYAMFSNGTVFKNDLDVHLQKTGNSNTVLYTNVSTDATVQTSGYATLSNGESNISFDQAFASAVSSEIPIVVTVTPVGNSNGVYLSEVSTTGFKVVENNGGKSNVTITYIAIGKRAGYENPQLPQEVVNVEYTSNLARGLHSDSDTETNGEGLYYENGKLIVGIHPSTLADPNRAATEVETAEPPAGFKVAETDNKSNDGKAEETVKDEGKTEVFKIITPQGDQLETIPEVTPQQTQPESVIPETK